jgi:hypothetical protein
LHFLIARCKILHLLELKSDEGREAEEGTHKGTRWGGGENRSKRSWLRFAFLPPADPQTRRKRRGCARKWTGGFVLSILSGRAAKRCIDKRATHFLLRVSLRPFVSGGSSFTHSLYPYSR